MQLTEPVSEAKVREFVAYYRGTVAAADHEKIHPYFDKEKLRESYVRDLTVVLDALELVVRRSRHGGEEK